DRDRGARRGCDGSRAGLRQRSGERHASIAHAQRIRRCGRSASDAQLFDRGDRDRSSPQLFTGVCTTGFTTRMAIVVLTVALSLGVTQTVAAAPFTFSLL